MDLDAKASILRVMIRESLSAPYSALLLSSFFFDGPHALSIGVFAFPFPGDAYGTARNFGKPISIRLSFLQGEAKARARAARDYGKSHRQACEHVRKSRVSTFVPTSSIVLPFNVSRVGKIRFLRSSPHPSGK